MYNHYKKVIPVSTTLLVASTEGIDERIERAIGQLQAHARELAKAGIGDHTIDRATVNGTPSLAYGVVDGLTVLTIAALVTVECAEWIDCYE